MGTHVMPMDEILKLRSADFDGLPLHSCLDLVDFDGYPEFYGKLRERMQETRTNAVPLYVENGWLLNGHHRVKIGTDLEFTEMHVTDEHEWDTHWREIV